MSFEKGAGGDLAEVAERVIAAGPVAQEVQDRRDQSVYPNAEAMKTQESGETEYQRPSLDDLAALLGKNPEDFITKPPLSDSSSTEDGAAPSEEEIKTQLASAHEWIGYAVSIPQEAGGRADVEMRYVDIHDIDPATRKKLQAAGAFDTRYLYGGSGVYKLFVDWANHNGRMVPLKNGFAMAKGADGQGLDGDAVFQEFTATEMFKNSVGGRRVLAQQNLFRQVEAMTAQKGLEKLTPEQRADLLLVQDPNRLLRTIMGWQGKSVEEQDVAQDAIGIQRKVVEGESLSMAEIIRDTVNAEIKSQSDPTAAAAAVVDRELEQVTSDDKTRVGRLRKLVENSERLASMTKRAYDATAGRYGEPVAEALGAMIDKYMKVDEFIDFLFGKESYAGNLTAYKRKKEIEDAGRTPIEPTDVEQFVRSDLTDRQRRERDLICAGLITARASDKAQEYLDKNPREVLTSDEFTLAMEKALQEHPDEFAEGMLKHMGRDPKKNEFTRDAMFYIMKLPKMAKVHQ